MKTLPLHDDYVAAGADFDDGGSCLVPGHFGDPDGEYRAAIASAVLIDLSCRSKIELAGSEARAFLNNLCTNEVKSLAVGAGCEAFLITAKGKVVAHLNVGHYQLQDAANLWLDAVADQATDIVEYLGHYLISEQVELADRTPDFGLFHLCGPSAAAILQRAVGQDFAGLPLLHNRAVNWPWDGLSGHIRRNHMLGLDGYDLFCPAAASLNLWRQLRDAGAVPTGMETYETLRIEAGTSEFGPDFDKQRFVVEVGRTAQAICHTKGCYLGQESVVMARDRGQVNRTLMGVQAQGPELLASGARLLRGADEVGQITSATYSPRLSQAIALAYVRRGNQEPGMELVAEPLDAARTVTVCALPFIPQAAG
jgi:tRNA-modifying protein YgfZ